MTRCRKRRIITCILGLLPMAAAAVTPVVRDSVTVSFRTSKIDIDPGYMDNAAEIERIRTRMRELFHPDSSYVLAKLEVVGGASPEGSVAFNEWLSVQRAKRIYNHIRAPRQPEDTVVDFTYLGRDWKGLRQLVDADPDVPHREAVLFLLDDIIANSRNGELEKHRNLSRLRMLKGGAPYRYMYRKLFPSLRASKLFFNIYKLVPMAELANRTESFVPLALPPVIRDTVTVYETWCPPCRPFYMSLGTNMLYDALAVPNIQADFYLGRNLSLRASWMYGWWNSNRRHRYWRIYGGDVELRWWLGAKAHEKPLTGHHIGIYGQTNTYDFEFGGKGYMGGEPGENLWHRANWGAGVSYGYSLPVGRRLNLDFELGIGYFGGKYYEYVPYDGMYDWVATKRLNYFGPTKAEISLVWLIGCDNYNRTKSKEAEKGGDR